MKTHAFIHIPKNAGTSIREALHDHPYIQYYGHDVRRADVAHLKKIYVIREPGDRFASAFFYLRNHGRSQAENKVFANPNELLEALVELDPRALRMMRLSDEIHTIDDVPIFTDWVFAPQHRWVWEPHYLMDFDWLHLEFRKWSHGCKLPRLNCSQHEPFDYSLDSMKFLKLLYKQDYKLYDKASLDL